MRSGWSASAVVIGLLAPWALGGVPALAVDEIQVYNAEIAEVGQWTYQQHLNYTWQGLTQPEFPGGLVPNHSLQGTPEFAYGMTDWWESAGTRRSPSTTKASFFPMEARSATCSWYRTPKS